ncbi:hypothetical protein ABPG75_009928 [Micractinium tetrahymenae]
MVPVRLIIKGWRKGVSRLDAFTTDQDDPEERAAYEKRRGAKHGIQKAPYVLANMFKRVFGGKKRRQQQSQPQRPEAGGQEVVEAPTGVPLGATQAVAVT